MRRRKLTWLANGSAEGISVRLRIPVRIDISPNRIRTTLLREHRAAVLAIKSPTIVFELINRSCNCAKLCAITLGNFHKFGFNRIIRSFRNRISIPVIDVAIPIDARHGGENRILPAVKLGRILRAQAQRGVIALPIPILGSPDAPAAVSKARVGQDVFEPAGARIDTGGVASGRDRVAECLCNRCMIGIFDTVIFEVKIYRQRRLMTFQQRNNVICTLHSIVSILCIRISVYAVRNTQALALSHIALKIAIGIPAIRLTSVDIANLQDCKVNTCVLDFLPIDIFLVPTHIDALQRSTFGHFVHRARLDAEVDCVIVLQVATQLAVLVAPGVCLVVTDHGVICRLLVLGIERLGGRSVLLVHRLVFIRSVGGGCFVLRRICRVSVVVRLIVSIARGVSSSAILRTGCVSCLGSRLLSLQRGSIDGHRLQKRRRAQHIGKSNSDSGFN